MRRWLVVLVVLAGCGGSAPPPPRPTPSPQPTATTTPPRWPGPVAYAADGAGLDIFVRDSESDVPRQLTSGRRDEFSPNWSPLGLTLAYRVNPPRGDEGDIWVMNADGSGKRNLTRSPGVADWSPAFSPDGRTIAYMSAAGGSHELWLMDILGGSQRQLTHADELSEYPSWSPFGQWLTFGGTRGGNFEVMRITATGRREQNLTRHPARDKWPAWSPDGKRIAFMSDRDGGDDVFVMRADGSDVRNVTRTPDLYETHPVWTPDGRLTFLQHGDSGPVHVRVLEGGYDLPIDAVFVYDWVRHPS